MSDLILNKSLGHRTWHLVNIQWLLVEWMNYTKGFIFQVIPMQ